MLLNKQKNIIFIPILKEIIINHNSLYENKILNKFKISIKIKIKISKDSLWSMYLEVSRHFRNKREKCNKQPKS
jgi:hypothetical protein